MFSFYLPSWISFCVQILTMIFYTYIYELKTKAYINKDERRAKQNIKIFIIFIKICSYFSRVFFPLFPLDDICFVLFYVNRSKILRRSIRRIWQILLNIKEIVLLQLLLLFLVAYLLFIMTYGNFEKLKIQILGILTLTLSIITLSIMETFSLFLCRFCSFRPLTITLICLF